MAEIDERVARIEDTLEQMDKRLGAVETDPRRIRTELQGFRSEMGAKLDGFRSEMSPRVGRAYVGERDRDGGSEGQVTAETTCASPGTRPLDFAAQWMNIVF
jgi:hypothetical protein